MKKAPRSYRMYLEDIQIAMNRIAEYILGYHLLSSKIITKQ